MYYNKVEICGVNTSHLKVLSDEEKRELLLRAREGDEVVVSGIAREQHLQIKHVSRAKEN